MKAITKEKLIEIVQNNFKAGEPVFEDEMRTIFNQSGDDWFLVDGMLQLVKKA